MLAAGIPGRIAWCLAAAAARVWRRRARHADTLTVIARPGPAPDVAVIDDDHAAVYCLPGRGRIVLATGAMHRLDRRQLDAVLAHERAHLSGRHHLVLAFAAVLNDAFPAVRFFTVAAVQAGTLVEAAADDTAVRRAHRLSLAGALLTVAAAQIPAGALGAGGTAAAQRIRRLIDPPRPASATRRALTCLALTAAGLLATSAPVLALILACCCPQGHYGL